MKKQTILYIGGFELPDKNAAAHRVLSNAKAMRDCGYEVFLAGVNKCEKSLNLTDVQGFTTYSVKYPKNILEWVKYHTSIKIYKKFIRKHNINNIVCYNYQSIALWRMMNFCKKNNIKIYGDCTEWYEPDGNLIAAFIKKCDVVFRMEYLQPKLDGLIVISNYLDDYYKNKGVKNIINIPPLVDLAEKKWQIDSAKAFINNSYKFIYSGSPGTGNKDKLDIVVENLKYFYNNKKKDIIFNIVGITEDQYVANFNNNIRLTSDYNFAKFHGRISHLDSLKLLKESDFSIFFRENNLTNIAGFPTKFVESISAGTPVITNVSSNLEKYFVAQNSFIGFIINDLEAKQIETVLGKVLILEKGIIEEFKNECFKSKLFHYQKFNGVFRSFLIYNTHAARKTIK